MRIKELHLRNIASIEKADIDFEKGIIDRYTHEPAGIFLISGDTGTGKSVILDGISMALYKTTPRIEGVANKTKNSFTNNRGESVSINSIEQYTRLGISDRDECYSELVFEGNDGKEYRARLELGMTMSNRDINGNRHLKYRSPKWTVKVGTEDWIKVEAKTGQPILDAIGLSFTQFGRMAMLAQGQFASFLTGDKSEREQILEQLTNTERFSTYGNAISRLYSSAKSARESAETAFRTQQSHPLTPEEEQQLTDDKKKLESENKDIAEKLSELQNTLDTVNNITTLNEKMTEAKNRKAELEAVTASEEYKERLALVRDWDSTGNERRWLTEKNNAEQQRTDASAQLRESEKTFMRLSADLAHREKALASDKEEARKLAEWTEQRKALDEVYTKADAITLQLRQYDETQSKLHSAEKLLTQEKDKTEVLARNLSDNIAKADKAKQDVKAKQDAIDTLIKERTGMNPDAVNTMIKDNSERRNAISGLQMRIGEVEKSRQAAESTKKDIQKDEKKLAVCDENLKAAQKEYDEAARAENDARSLLTTMRMSVEDTLTELRSRLQKAHADTCPLCGQHIESGHLDNDFSNMLSPLEQREEKAKKELENATKVLDRAKSEYDTLKGSVSSRQKSLESSLKDIDSKDREITTDAVKLGLDASLPIAGQIAGAMEKLSETIAELEAKQRKAEALQTEINRLNEEKKPLDASLSAAQESQKNAQIAADTNRKDIEKYEETIRELNGTMETLTAHLTASVGESYPEWLADTQGTIVKFMAEANEYCRIKKEAEQRKAYTEKAEERIKPVREIRAAILDANKDWNPAAEPMASEAGDINGKWTSLLADITHNQREISDATATIDERQRMLSEYYTKTGKTEQSLTALASAESGIAAAREFVTNTDTGLKSAENNIGNLRAEIDKCLKKLKAERTEDIPAKEPLEVMLGEQKLKLNSNAENIGSIKARLSDNEDNKRKVLEAKNELDKATAQFEKWDRMNKVFGGTRFRTLVQTYILRPLLNNANIYLERITDRYSLTCSEENEQLSILVHDRYNKGQVRSVTVLSGGERFMISLALSLALSLLNRADMNINILFIDEGFGTLDETSLNSVMSTLERLQEIAGQSNRRVGIISHREELAERIPVKINVRKKGEGRSIVETEY